MLFYRPISLNNVLNVFDGCIALKVLNNIVCVNAVVVFTCPALILYNFKGMWKI